MRVRAGEQEPSAEVAELRERLAEAISRAERAEAMVVERPSPLLEAAAEEVQRGERLMRAVFTGSSDALILLDNDGNFVDVNPAACALFREAKPSLLRRRVGYGATDVMAALGQFDGLRRGDQGRGRAPMVCADGETRMADYSTTANIVPGLHLLALRDVTEEELAAQSLARTEAELRRSDARFRALVEKSAEAIALFSTDGRFLYVTRHSSEIIGIPPEDIIGARAVDFLHPDDRDVVLHALAQARVTGGFTIEFRIVRRDGAIRWLEATGTNLLDDPAVGALVTNIRDVTARHEATREREKLIESLSFERSRLGTLLQKAPAFMAVVRGENHVFELVNEAFYAMVGDRPLAGIAMADAIGEFARQGIIAVLDRVAETGEPFVARGFAISVARPGSPPDVHFVNMVIQVLAEADGTYSGIFLHGVDVTDETLARRRLHAQFNGGPVPMFVWQRVVIDGKRDFLLRDYNDAAIRTSKGAIVHFRDRSAMALFDGEPDVLEDFDRCIDGGEIFRREIDRPMKSAPEAKRIIVTYAPAPPDVVLAHIEDVTERQKLEDHLRQAQKMEAIGRLAGGVAHDFNNILSVVLSYTSLVLEELPPDHASYADLEQVRLAGERAVELTRQLLTFSRRQVLQPRQMSISETLVGLEKMLGRLVGEDIELLLRSAARGTIEADPGQVEQVIMNLVINARDAMPDGGRLTVETSDVEVNEAQGGGEGVGTPAGAYVLLTVEDTGVGMEEETLARIFEPFFTTKGLGKGTGLGLATVFGIVQQAGGTIHVESTPGRGTIFRIHLRRANTFGPRLAATAAHVAARGGKETILVVEDEEPLRALAVRVLVRAGYDVLEARDGEAACEVAESCKKKLDLLVTDVVMPRMNGRELADRLSKARRDMKTLFVSGYTDDAIVLRRVVASEATFLQKPITPDTLLAKVREVLDAEVDADASASA